MFILGRISSRIIREDIEYKDVTQIAVCSLKNLTY